MIEEVAGPVTQGWQILLQKWVRLATKGDKSWNFTDQILVHYFFPIQNVLKLILKSLRFFPFGANLNHFGAKPEIPALI